MSVIFGYPFTDDIDRECRHKLFPNFKNIVQFIYGKVSGICIPVKTIFLHTLFEFIEFSAFIQHLLKMLGQGDIELVITSESIEFTPEHIKEHLLFVPSDVMHRSDIEQNGIHRGRFKPQGRIPHLADTYFRLAFRMRQRICVFYSLFHPCQRTVTALWIEAIPQILQEV